MAQVPAAETLFFGAHPEARVQVVRHASLSSGALCGAAGGAADRTGLMLWPGARALCRAILACPALANALVLELGAGAGVCSAVAAVHAPAAVLTTDGDPAALELAGATWVANAAGRARHTPWAARVFRWDEAWPAATAALLQEARSLLPGGRDLPPTALLASECIYPSTSPACCAHFFAACASLLGQGRSSASFLLFSYVPRAPATSLAMLAAADAAGLHWELWDSAGSAAAQAVGCAASLGEESGACVLRFTRAPPGPRADLAARARAVFPDAAESIARAQALREEAEEDARSGAWGAPPVV